jgi:hypothetical protein
MVSIGHTAVKLPDRMDRIGTESSPIEKGLAASNEAVGHF